MRAKLFLGALLALVAIGALRVISLRSDNASLRIRLNEERALHQTRRAGAEAPKSHAQATAGEEQRSAQAASETAARLTRLRAEVASLETRAAEQYAANSEPTDAPSRNRDPEKAMTKLEHMQNVGQGTPAGAIQTLFWAALKGEDQVMARTIGWDEATRPKVQALIERLPAESRAHYPTPEALAALYISKFALDVSAIHISETVQQDATHAMLTVKGLTGRDEHLPMQRGPNGWRLLAGEPNLRALSDELAGRK